MKINHDDLLSSFAFKVNWRRYNVGKNEKTKIVAKLQKKGGGAPQREAPISPEEHKAMMAYYHKKQEEMKALATNSEDDYTNSAWANSKALKNHFSGVGNVSVAGARGAGAYTRSDFSST